MRPIATGVARTSRFVPKELAHLDANRLKVSPMAIDPIPPDFLFHAKRRPPKTGAASDRREVVWHYYWPAYTHSVGGSIVLLAGVCRCRLSSSATTRRRNVTHQWQHATAGQ